MDRRAPRRTVGAVAAGHGESDWPGIYSLRLIGRDVVELLDQLRDPVLDVVGHSLGGLVACLAVTERPRGGGGRGG